MHKKFGKDHAWGSGDTLSADRQTDTQTHSSKYFAIALAGKVINTKNWSQV